MAYQTPRVHAAAIAKTHRGEQVVRLEQVPDAANLSKPSGSSYGR
ncbi:hypothetical protein MMAN_26020 [Mycobacterium mantenii]|uniref:Uncharacterized protein n=1 Tax=Mycobacterium mantenii TaxID=560555 RepID=A0ABN6A929_MYCNT|nr:hypothetical protein MMAN_26020 [Mycobacterium mantenii]